MIACSWILDEDDGRTCSRRAPFVLHDGTLVRPVCGLHAARGRLVGWRPLEGEGGDHPSAYRPEKTGPLLGGIDRAAGVEDDPSERNGGPRG